MLRTLLALGLLMGGLGLLQPQGGAGEKKKGVKPAAEPKETVVNGFLIDTDEKDAAGRKDSYCKVYTYKMTEGKTYQIDMVSQELDSYLRLENPEGKEVAFDDDGGGMLNARIQYKAVKTGDYKVVATTLFTATGKFTLTIKEVKAGAVADAKPIELKNEKGGATYTGNLEQTDPKYKNKVHKLFLFTMEAGKNYQIDHSSKAFDAYLYLEDPDGKLLAENDDAGPGTLDSQIIHKAAKTGKYRIVASHLFGNQLGEFTLTIRQTDGGNEEKKKE